MDDVRGDVRRQAAAAAFWEAVVRILRRRPDEDNPLLVGLGSAFDPVPRVRKTWLSEDEGRWADWTGLGCDLRRAMIEADRSRSSR